MTVRVVEWKKPYTWWEAINIDENKVISLKLRDENNLIIYDEWDDEIYVDLQLKDWIRPTDAFPVWCNTGRVLVADDWDVTGTIVVFKTTSGDNIKLLYWDDWTLWIDNWTWIFKQIYFKWDVDIIVQSLQNQIDVLSWLGRFLSLWDCENWEPISFPLSLPYEYHTGDWFMVNVVDNTTNYKPTWSSWGGTASTTAETNAVEIGDVYIYDWTDWLLQKNWWWWGSAVMFSQVLWDPYDNTNLATALNSKQGTLTAWTNITIDTNTNTISATAWSDIVYATQAEYEALLPWAASDGKHYFIYTSSVVPPFTPWVNTVAYYPLDWDADDYSGNSYDGTATDVTYITLSSWLKVATFNGTSSYIEITNWFSTSDSITFSVWFTRLDGNFRTLFSNEGSNWIWLYIDYYNGQSNLRVGNWVDTAMWVAWTTTWTWYNLIFTCSGNTGKVYINWTLDTSTYLSSFTSLTTTSIIWNEPLAPTRWWYGNISRIIIENQARDATAVSNYYNLTKWDYWIS